MTMTESKIKPASDAEIVVWGQLHGITSMSHHALIARITAEKALREELVAAMKEEKEARSEFEKVNNSSHKLTEKVRAGERLGLAEIARDAAIVRAEQFEKEVSQ